MRTKRNHRRKFWAVVETEHRSEWTARRSALGLGVECPLLAYRSRAERGVRRIAPLFQGYIMVRLDRRAGWSGLDRARGVRTILRGARGDAEESLPASIPDHEADFLLSLVGEDGYVHLREHEPPALVLGEAVRATAGAFVGQIGEYRGQDPRDRRRSMFVFEFMDRRVAQSIDRYHLEPLKIGSSPALVA